MKQNQDNEAVELFKPAMKNVPPHDLELEAAVLGALMLERDAFIEVADILYKECFYRNAHKAIFEAIASLMEKGEPTDILAVTNALRTAGTLEKAGGAYYITQLTDRVNQTGNIVFHSRILQQFAIKRQIISTCVKFQNEAFSHQSDAIETLDSLQHTAFAIAERNFKRGVGEMGGLLGAAFAEIEETRKIGTGITGVPSGFPAIDRMTAGWQRSDLLVVAARPGMGKTAFVLSTARNAAVDFNKPVAVFSLEMSAVQLTKRLISSEAEIDSEAIRSGKLSNPEMAAMMHRTGKLSKAPIYIDDTPGLSVMELRAKCRRLKSQNGIELVIVDYLQLMAGDGKTTNREQEIAYISRSLKKMAKELDVPVIALSQLSRSVESRTDKRPQLSDLRESGSIEQDADMVAFLYRPEYYGLKEDENGLSTEGLGEFIIAKQRGGALGTVSLRFVGAYTKFVPWEDSYRRPHPEGPGSTVLKIEEKPQPTKEEDVPF